MHQLPPAGRTRLRRIRFSSLVTLVSLLAGCIANAPRISSPSEQTTAVPTQSDGSAGLWTLLANGLESRTWRPPGTSGLSGFSAVRIDPGYYTFRVHYSPGAPRTVSEWRDALPGAAVIVNANFFDPQFNALGLIVSDGVASGQSFYGYGGMFQVSGGFPRVRSLAFEPYGGEFLEQAAQAFPMLMINGGANYERLQGDSSSRRTIVAQDSQGFIIFIASNGLFGMRLADLSSALASSDMGLTNALNLDGGGSTMLAVLLPNPSIVPSFDAVPAVIAAYPR